MAGPPTPAVQTDDHNGDRETWLGLLTAHEPYTKMDHMLRMMIYIIESDAATYPGFGLDISRTPGRAVTLIEETLHTTLPTTRAESGRKMLAALLEPDIAVRGRDPHSGGHPDVERVIKRLKEVLGEAEERRRINAEARAAEAARGALGPAGPPPRRRQPRPRRHPHLR